MTESNTVLPAPVRISSVVAGLDSEAKASLTWELKVESTFPSLFCALLCDAEWQWIGLDL